MRAVYRVRPTVPGPSGEDARFHHHTWKSGTGARPSSGPVAAARRAQGAAAWSAQHPGHHHHHHNHGDKDHHHHQTHTQQLQEGRPSESGSISTCSFIDDWVFLNFILVSHVIDLSQFYHLFAAIHKHYQHRHLVGGYRPNGKDCRASRECPGEDCLYIQQPFTVQHDTKGKKSKCLF